MMVRLWYIAISLAIVALAAFLGVGIIATNTTFAPLFQKYFFWIAIVWVFTSSLLLIWLVKAFGGNKKDMLSSFLAAVGIWLVVIQVSLITTLFLACFAILMHYCPLRLVKLIF